MEESGSDDYQIVDTESFKGKGDEEFSHNALIMKIFKRILDIRSRELTEGTNVLYTDPKTGKSTVIHKEDQREAYFGAVSIAIELMRCVFDEEALKKITELENKIEKVMNSKLLEQWVYWASSSDMKKEEIIKTHGRILKDVFNDNLQFKDEYISQVIFIYDKIFGELNKLAERENFFGEAIGYA